MLGSIENIRDSREKYTGSISIEGMYIYHTHERDREIEA